MGFAKNAVLKEICPNILTPVSTVTKNIAGIIKVLTQRGNAVTVRALKAVDKTRYLITDSKSVATAIEQQIASEKYRNNFWRKGRSSKDDSDDESVEVVAEEKGVRAGADDDDEKEEECEFSDEERLGYKKREAFVATKAKVVVSKKKKAAAKSDDEAAEESDDEEDAVAMGEQLGAKLVEGMGAELDEVAELIDKAIDKAAKGSEHHIAKLKGNSKLRSATITKLREDMMNKLQEKQTKIDASKKTQK